MSIYKGMTQAQLDNESKWLNDLVSKGGGNGIWAKNQLEELNKYQPTTQASTPTTPAVQSKPATGNSGNSGSSGGSGNSVVTNNNNVNSVNKPANSQTVQTQPSTNAFISPGSTVNENGTRYHSFGDNDKYKVKDYLSGNSDLQYALEQAMKANGSNVYDVDGYAKSLYERVGTKRDNGSIVTLEDVNRELDRLGLSDYNSKNVIHTAGGSLIPNNEFVTTKEGSFGGSNSADSQWASYGGQDYLVGGDSANYVDYVNGKTGNTTLLDLLFDNMQSNPYAQGDAEFMQQYNNALNQFNNAAGITGNTGGFTGNQNVDNVINYVNSLNNYNSVTGGSVGTTNLLDMLQSYLNGGLEANQNFINQQRAYAEQQAQQQASDAYVNKVLAGDALKQQLSALGLGTSGAVQSAQMGVQGQYGNNLAQINSNLAQMLNGLSEQELQVLTDYYNNMANYAYDVTQYEADQAYRNAQLALQQQQAQYDEAYRQQQLALQLQQMEYERALADQQWNLEQQNYKDKWNWEQQKYQDALKQQNFNNDVALQELGLKLRAQDLDEQKALKSGSSSALSNALKQAGIYKVFYDEGLMSGDAYTQALAGLGVVDPSYLTAGNNGKKPTYELYTSLFPELAIKTALNGLK